MARKPINLIGKRFGTRVVTGDSGKRRNRGAILWSWICDCGNTGTATAHHLRTFQRCNSCQKGIDLTGQRFGTKVVTGDSGKRHNQGAILWSWICDCGNIGESTAQQLRKFQRCSGCQIPVIDLTGQRFGRLTVIKRLPNNKHNHVMWECRCDCGNTTSVSTISLRSGNTTSCGCNNKVSKAKDLTGQRFGTRVVTGDSGKRQGSAVLWNYTCDCGNTGTATAHQLRTFQCCNSCQKGIDLTGQRFGMWTVIKRVANRGIFPYWLCKCDCGTTREVLGSSLRDGKSTSCGKCTRKEVNLKNRKEIMCRADSNGCWNCLSHWLDKKGYPHISVDGKRFIMSRYIYEQYYKLSILPGVIVRHICDNPQCINPHHLELGSHQSNMDDMVERDRQAKGEKNGSAKLTESDVRAIRQDKTTPNYEFAELYGVTYNTVYDVRNYKTWKHVI